ncbi:unnamed protein product [Porites evermanni]|uniref:SURP motif domain-containing protein n=1 Tax=Porites evermanni TaxID=104178 RepID=A0ABN8LUT3_9CNID|nr:unnamed protein product [Porites evermanni]
MSGLFDAHKVGLPKDSRSRPRRKEDDLLVFGYACKLFEDYEKAAAFDPEKSLIPWMGDESLRIDRYDARLHLTDKAQFIAKSSDGVPSLTPEEEEIERLCDEERYMDLNRDMEEYESQQEEEIERLCDEERYMDLNRDVEEYESQQGNDNVYCILFLGSMLYKTQQDSSFPTSDVQKTVLPPAPLPAVVAPPPEPFVPPDELEIPQGMEIPETAKMQAIIERTAAFVAKQGKQMEILVKAKQSGNPQFDFLLMDNWLNPYYKHVLGYITEGKFTPEIPQQPSTQPQEEEKESDSSEEESDGEYELHPLLQASLHKKVTRSRPTSASSSPVPLGNKFNRTFAPVTSGLSSTAFPHDHTNNNNAHVSIVDEEVNYSMWYPQDDMYGHYVSSAGYTYHPPVVPVLSVADMIPPPPPPPGEGPLEEEWLEFTSSVPPLPPPPPPPVPPALFLHDGVDISEALPPPDPTGMSTMPLGTPQVIPPPPDLQPIVDKLAIYVAKNGPDFESIIKAKNDPRFEFLNPWNTHHGYYNLKKQEALANQQLQQQSATSEENGKNIEVSKGPISFSIKAKETKKPKIEYRTSVIYKQSCEQGESDEEVNEEGSEAECKEKSEANGRKPEQETAVNSGSTSTENSAPEVDSIKAAERIAQHLESESRDKQLQIERRRKASLFISMLKKTNPGDEVETNQSSQENLVPSGRTRKFMEKRQDTRPESPPAKRSRISDDDSDSLSGGVGSPSPGSIRVTQDLMAKVLAASRNK